MEFHPLLYAVQRPLLEFCREHGIVLQACLSTEPGSLSHLSSLSLSLSLSLSRARALSSSFPSPLPSLLFISLSLCLSLPSLSLSLPPSLPPLVFCVHSQLDKLSTGLMIPRSRYAPLGSTEGVSQVLGHPTINAIAGQHGVTAAEVALRWALSHGVSVLPKSSRPERIRANAAPSLFSAVCTQPAGREEDAQGETEGVADRAWALSAAEMAALDSLSGGVADDATRPAMHATQRFCWDPSDIL